MRVLTTISSGTGNGTGYSGLYPPEVYAQYESLDTTPDNLLLWFHHVPWTYPLKSGTTVIQHFYDAHYAGAATAQTFETMWASLKGLPGIDEQRFEEQLFRQTYQSGHSLVWRDSIVDFYFNMTQIPDAEGRVGNHPYRIEAEDMVLEGYEVFDANPFEAASGFRGIMTTGQNDTAGTASTVIDGARFPSGTYDLAVNFFDAFGGQASWEVFLGNRSVGSWLGDMEVKLGHAVSSFPDESAARRITFKRVEVTAGEELRVVGTPQRNDAAFLDYVSLLPEGVVD